MRPTEAEFPQRAPERRFQRSPASQQLQRARWRLLGKCGERKIEKQDRYRQASDCSMLSPGRGFGNTPNPSPPREGQSAVLGRNALIATGDCDRARYWSI